MDFNVNKWYSIKFISIKTFYREMINDYFTINNLRKLIPSIASLVFCFY